MYDKKIFSERIKELRNSRKETQKEFAAAVNSTAATISAYENGTKNPSLEVVASIAKTCSVSIDWLCGLSNKKQINKKVETYSDILSFLYEITLADYNYLLGFSIDFEQRTYDDRIYHYGVIYFNGDIIVDALIGFNKIYDLYNSQTITDEMYTTLMEGLFKKYNLPINKGYTQDELDLTGWKKLE